MSLRDQRGRWAVEVQPDGVTVTPPHLWDRSGLSASEQAEPAREARGGNVVLKGGWVIVARVTAQAAQFMTLIIAARVMAPADFGTFALLSSVAIGLTRLSEAGWREYVMTALRPVDCAQANVLALLCGLAAFIVSLLAGLGLFLIYHSLSSALVMMLMGFWVVLTTLSATQAGILVKRNELRTLSLAQIVGEVAGIGAALAAFSLEGGIFGLVAAKLGAQATTLTLFIAATRWFPLVRLHASTTREAISFSRRILVARVIGYTQDNIALFVIGAIVGPAATGLFRAAGRLAGSLFEVVSEPARLLAWSTFESGDPGPAADRLLGLTFLVATPLFIGLAINAENAIHLLLGPEWTDCAPLLVAFSIAAWFNSLNTITEPLLVKSGRIDIVPRLSLVFTLLNLGVLLASAPFGIFWIAVGQTCAAIAMVPLILAVQRHYGRVSFRTLGRRAGPALLGAAALVAAVLIVRWTLPASISPLLRVAVEVGSGGIAYLAVVVPLVPVSVWKLRDMRHSED